MIKAVSNRDIYSIKAALFCNGMKSGTFRKLNLPHPPSRSGSFAKEIFGIRFPNAKIPKMFLLTILYSLYYRIFRLKLISCSQLHICRWIWNQEVIMNQTRLSLAMWRIAHISLIMFAIWAADIGSNSQEKLDQDSGSIKINRSDLIEFSHKNVSTFFIIKKEKQFKYLGY